MEKTDTQTQLKELIKKIVIDLLKHMGFSCEIDIFLETENEQENLVCNIKTEESNFLIGQYGVNLQSLQHIARVLVRKQTDEKINFVLDVNSYRKEKNQSIILLAKSIAQQVLADKKSITLRPMSPYERRLVHMELSKNTQIKTESIGEGEDRKVIVSPAGLI